jgi:hypothetical protein
MNTNVNTVSKLSLVMQFEKLHKSEQTNRVNTSNVISVKRLQNGIDIIQPFYKNISKIIDL